MFAARVNQMQSFMALMQMVIMPMFFLSGALFSVASLPAWLAVLNRLDPLTYAVVADAPRDLRPPERLHRRPPRARSRESPGGAGTCPRCSRPVVIAALGLGMLSIAIWEFSSRGVSACAATPSCGIELAAPAQGGIGQAHRLGQLGGVALRSPFDQRLQRCPRRAIAAPTQRG